MGEPPVEPVSESELSWIWAGQRYPAEALKLVDGRGLRIVNPGRPGLGSGPDFLDGTTPALDPATTGCDDQGLTERMGVPCRARARLEGDARATNARRSGRLEQRVNADCAGEIIRRPLAGRL